MWIKLPPAGGGGLLNLAQAVRFEVVYGSTYQIRVVTVTGGSTVVGTGFASEADAQAKLDAFLVWDLNA